MKHYALQTNMHAEEIAKKLGIKSPMDIGEFNKEEECIYAMSINPFVTKTLDDFTEQEILEHCMWMGYEQE